MASGQVPGTLLVLLALSLSVLAARDLSETKYLHPLKVPSAIHVPAYELQMTVFGKGVQYYSFNGTNWVNYNVSAVIYNEAKEAIGNHFFLTSPDAYGGQPTWVVDAAGYNYSSVTGKPLEQVTVKKSAVTWILFIATQTTGSTFGDVAYVQRYKTTKGLAPSSTIGASVGDIKTTPFTSHYAFYVPAYGIAKPQL